MNVVKSGRMLRDDLGLNLAFRSPSNESERVLASLWQTVFQLDRVGVDDDYFQLGGDSLAATALASLIEKQFGVNFSPADIMTHSTVSAQAAFCAGKAGCLDVAQLPKHVMGVNLAGGMSPLFLIHGANGFVVFRREFFEILGTGQPVYVFQAPGLDGRDQPLTKVEEYAAVYAKVIRQVLPQGPWRIAASCDGCLIALELCHLLVAGGGAIDKLILIDPPPVPSCVAAHYPPAGRKSLKNKLKIFLWKVSRVFTWRGAASDAKAYAYIRALKDRAVRQKRMMNRIRAREAGHGPVSPGVESSYKPDDVLRVGLALTDAILRYKPRPWPGNAHMIISTGTRGREMDEDPFWRSHLGAIDYEVIDCTHGSLFKGSLSVLAGLVSVILKGTHAGSRSAS